MIALVFHLVACALDVSHCARWQPTDHGMWCAEVDLAPRCPAELEPAGFHVMRGVPVCTRGCSDGAPTR